MDWGFYGRDAELDQLQAILSRGRWFFARITGRRRIGKTSLIQRALQASGRKQVLYVQIPDSGPAGVLSAVADAMEAFEIDAFPAPTSLRGLARLIDKMVRSGFVVALDEFQYFNRAQLREFTSHLQAVVDELAAAPSQVPGGLFVLGSIHTDLVALLEDRSAPLYNRTTDQVALDHLDIASVNTLLQAHSEASPEQLLFMWNLFEGVPKFYRDCFEQGLLRAGRRELLTKTFFQSSSPLQSEAEHWFLSELRGRYDVALKFIARNPGCSNAELKAHAAEFGAGKQEQVGGYLTALTDKYRIIEKRQPIFAKPKGRKGRYYLRDNFLRAWLACLASSVAAINFRPVEGLVQTADRRLVQTEGYGFERLVATLYEELGRKGLGDFALTHRIDGYWDRGDVEIDLVACDEDSQTLRFGTCKRNPNKLVPDFAKFDAHVSRFLKAHPKYQAWTIEKVALAPRLGGDHRADIMSRGYIPQDLIDLTRDL